MLFRSRALDAFWQKGGMGCNVTLPFKRDAWQQAAGSSPEASQAQAANTLVRQASGWFAHTTDGAGLMTDLTENHDLDLSGKRVLVLGAGGAAAGILGALLAQNPSQVLLVNRSLDRAQALSERFGSGKKVSATAWTDLSLKGGFDLVLNATSLGHHGEAPPLPDSVFEPGALCYDMNYFKASLPLMRLCEEIQQPYLDGLGMLVEQAARSFSIWTGKKPETRTAIDALRRDAA